MTEHDEAKRTHAAMLYLSTLIPTALENAPPELVERFDNALLNVAINRLVDAEGPERAATLLYRIVDVLQTGRVPTWERAVDLCRLDA